MSWVTELSTYFYGDAYGVRFYDQKKQKWGYRKVDEPLTPEVVEEHLSLLGTEKSYAAYVLKNYDPDDAKKRGGHIVVFDFDDHAGTLPDGYMDGVVATFATLLEVPYILVRSGGGRGYHIFIVIEHARRIDVLREAAKKILDNFNKSDVFRGPIRDEKTGKFPQATLAEGTGGLDKGEVEIFPKGSGLYLIALPLARNSQRMKVETRNGKLKIVPSDDVDVPLVKGKKPGPKASSSNELDRDAAFDAVAATLDPNDHKQWTDFGHLLIAAFGKDDTWAYRRWFDWSKLADVSRRSSDDELQKKWQTDLEDKPHTFHGRTFWHRARDAGYTGDVPFTKREGKEASIIDTIFECEIVRSEDHITFAQIAPRHYVPIKSSAFAHHVRRAEMLNNNTMISTEMLKAAIETTDAFASVKEQITVHRRFAKLNDARYMYLGDQDHTIIEIDAEGWRVVEECPLAFWIGDGKPIPMPIGGTLEDFRKYLNIDDDNLPFLLAWMIACILRPGLVSPIAVLSGEAGSAKSSALQFIIDLLDPKPGAKAGPPKSERDLVAAAKSSAIVSFDNASTLAMLSDPLCRLATGGGLREREFYTNSDVHSFDVIRPVIVSGIDPTAYEQDLIERIVKIELYPIETRIDDEELAEKVAAASPKALGFLLHLASQVLSRLDIEQVDGNARMRGFEKIGEIVARVLGYEAGWFVEQYTEMLETEAKEAAEADCVVNFVRTLFSSKGEVEKTATELLHMFDEKLESKFIVAEPKSIPKNSVQLGKRLKRASPALRKMGYKIEKTKVDGERKWRITAPNGLSDTEYLEKIVSDARDEAVPF